MRYGPINLSAVSKVFFRHGPGLRIFGNENFARIAFGGISRLMPGHWWIFRQIATRVLHFPGGMGGGGGKMVGTSGFPDTWHLDAIAA